MKGKYLGIVDADSILYRVAAMCEAEPYEKAEDTLRAFLWNNIYKPTQCKQYAFCVSGGESGRDQVAKAKVYKGQRTQDKPRHLKAIRKYFVESYKAFSVDDYEADDVVIAMYEKYRGDAVLIGIDKDAKQMAGLHYNYHQNHEKFFTVSGKQSQKYFFTQMLTGDNVDNIPGLPKVGVKGAEKLFDENPDTPPAKLVWDLYKKKGFDYDYYKEQYYLLRMQRDIFYPFEEHFIDMKDFVQEPKQEFDIG